MSQRTLGGGGRERAGSGVKAVGLGIYRHLEGSGVEIGLVKAEEAHIGCATGVVHCPAPQRQWQSQNRIAPRRQLET